jgi:hypothetical protein
VIVYGHDNQELRRHTIFQMPRKRPQITPTKIAKQGIPFQTLVGSVVQAFDPNALVKSEQWVDGPDGRRDMDVFVQGNVEGAPFRLLIECKDYNPRTTGKVGIEYVDALDSKRHDLQVDGAIICSNSGFTADSIRKAKRKHIGLIAILKAGDPRVKAVIKEEIYTRHIKIGTINISFHGECPPIHEVEAITYHGLPIKNWVMKRILLIAGANPINSANLLGTFQFTSPIEMEFAGVPAHIAGLDIRFPVQTKWFSQVVTIDASLGIYDYIRGKVQLAPGQTKYIINGVDIHGGEPIDFTPKLDELGAGLLPGGIRVDLMLTEGLEMVKEELIPNLDAFVVPEDLKLKIKPFDVDGSPLSV